METQKLQYNEDTYTEFSSIFKLSSKKTKSYKLYSLEHLNFEHAICFLNNLTLEGKSRATVLSYRRTLREFLSTFQK